jgi:hypothetical protein
MIFHVHSEYFPKNPDTLRRMFLARETWQRQSWVSTPVPDSQVRTITDELGKVPIVRDIINRAGIMMQPEDIVCFSNSDICFSDTASVRIACQIQKTPALFCNRRDFAKLDRPLADDEIKTGHLYCGTDAFAFRFSWWQCVNHSFPDLLLGREAWDAILRKLIQLSCVGLPIEAHDLTYHERHPSPWEQSVNRYRAKGQLHNIGIARAWCRDRGINPREFGLP